MCLICFLGSARAVKRFVKHDPLDKSLEESSFVTVVLYLIIFGYRMTDLFLFCLFVLKLYYDDDGDLMFKVQYTQSNNTCLKSTKQTEKQNIIGRYLELIKYPMNRSTPESHNSVCEARLSPTPKTGQFTTLPAGPDWADQANSAVTSGSTIRQRTFNRRGGSQHSGLF